MELTAVKTKNPRKSILPLLWWFALLSYLLRTNIAVAQQGMSRELGWNDVQIGYVFSAFLIGYTIFQVPAGMLGDRYGPRLILTISGVWWGITTLLSGLAPGFLIKGSMLALVGLMAFRFLLGIGQASTYPVAMTAVAEWFAPSRHAFINSVIFTGSTLGAAFAPPLVAHMMNAFGWRGSFYCTAIPPILIAMWWWRESKSDRARVPIAASSLRLAVGRNILFLCLSYFLYCYSISIFVYWLFKYLVDVRHLSIVNSGWATGLPWIVASFAVPLFGHLSARVSKRLGMLEGRRLIATSCLVVSALLLSVGAGAQNIAIVLAAISICVGLLFSTESSYWSTAIEVARQDAGSASGLMNLAGNLGGVLSTSLVPVLVLLFGWFYALLSGSVFALLATFCWFLIRSEAKQEGERDHKTLSEAAANF
ncbi:MAG: MFS transporter [Acidobacteriaceae bacterium]|nr:MFS transporter [Acidobacteriaceae bacterium]